MALRYLLGLLLYREMSEDLADVPYSYHFIAQNYYAKDKMMWKVTVTPRGCKEMVAVKGEAREVDET